MADTSFLMDSVHNYIEDKKKLEEEGWKLFYILESRFISENMSLYGTQMKNLENRIDKDIPKEKMRNFLKFGCPKKKFDTKVCAVKMIHPATKDGFCEGDCHHLENEFASDFKTENAITFIEAFKKIIGNKSIIPDKSLILLNKDSHHIIEPNAEKISKRSQKFEKFDRASKRKGQKLVTDFFPSKKKASSSSPKRCKIEPTTPDEVQGKTIVERILQKLRGDEVKIMWIPNNCELDPTQYISIWLLNEIATILQESPRDSKPADVVLQGIQELPNAMWKIAVELTEKFEDQYFEDIDEAENEVKIKTEPI